MLAVALGKVFRTALTGRCDARPDLAATPLPLEITIPALSCRGGPEPGRAAARAARLDRADAAGAARPAAAGLGEFAVPDPAADRSSGWPTRSTSSTCCSRCSTTPSTTGSAERGGQADPGRRQLAGPHPERDLITRRYLARRDPRCQRGGPAWPRWTTPNHRPWTTRCRDAGPPARRRPERAARRWPSCAGTPCWPCSGRRRPHRGRPGLRRGRPGRQLLDDPAFRRVIGVDVSHRALDGRPAAAP